MQEADRLARLREHRTRSAPDRDLAPEMMTLEKLLRRQHRAVGGVGVAWAQAVPKDLAQQTSPVSLTRGVLKVRVLDAATAHKMDRWLRQGGLDALIDAAPGQLKRVRLTQ
ncbi:MAG: DciA family protein [Phycisphaerales bacterium JB039]